MNWDFIYRGENRVLDEAARSEAGGSFVRLSRGCTHYELAVGDADRTIVLIHGFSVPYFIWDQTFEALASVGRRVLRYDLFGRGYSDRPVVRYDLALFVRQLADLLDALGIQIADLVGLSMGGAIASAFTVEFPARVRHLALIDPIGTEAMPLSLLYKAALLPGISELFLSAVGTDKMAEGLASDFYDPEHVTQFRDRYRTQMQFRGFKRAIVSTLRNKTVNGFPQVYEQLGQMNTPVLIFWGRDDRTLPLEQSEGILKRVPCARLQVIDQCGHIPNCERPDIVHPMLLDFLNSK